jgi:hypothetical protein
LFRRSYSQSEIYVDFVGVWDTVGALGIPIDGFRPPLLSRFWRFHDTTLSRYVLNAYHAIAIDERRRPSRPTLWVKKDGADKQTLEQVWFTGVHCDVGGGYRDPELSEIPLLWMADKARACGLAFKPDHLVLKKTGFDPEDRRAAIEVAPDPRGELHNSRTRFYRLLRAYDRRLAGTVRKCTAARWRRAPRRAATRIAATARPASPSGSQPTEISRRCATVDDPRTTPLGKRLLRKAVADIAPSTVPPRSARSAGPRPADEKVLEAIAAARQALVIEDRLAKTTVRRCARPACLSVSPSTRSSRSSACSRSSPASSSNSAWRMFAAREGQRQGLPAPRRHRCAVCRGRRRRRRRVRGRQALATAEASVRPTPRPRSATTGHGRGEVRQRGARSGVRLGQRFVVRRADAAQALDHLEAVVHALAGV